MTPVSVRSCDQRGRSSATSTSQAAGGGRVPLTKREREILGRLAEGLSGAQIAGELVLSPETVRTHVRNAMAKLGASTRSQAVALALKSNEISPEAFAPPRPSARSPPPTPVRTPIRPGARGDARRGLVSLYDVDGGGVYLAEEDGLSLRRVATAAGADERASARRRRSRSATGRSVGRRSSGAPSSFRRRRRRLEHRRADRGADGRRRPPARRDRAAPALSRPIGRSEMLLLQAFANRVAEVVLAGGEVDDRLARAMERFSASWSAGPRLELGRGVQILGLRVERPQRGLELGVHRRDRVDRAELEHAAHRRVVGNHQAQRLAPGGEPAAELEEQCGCPRCRGRWSRRGRGPGRSRCWAGGRRGRGGDRQRWSRRSRR